MSDDMDEIWALYADDGGQALDAVETALSALADQPANKEAISALFRGMHTFKGNSRILGLTSIETLAHVAEDLIGAVRDEGVALDNEIHALLFEAADRLRGMMADVLVQRQDGSVEAAGDLPDRMRVKLARCAREEAQSEVVPDEEFNDALLFGPSEVALANDPVYRSMFLDLVTGQLDDMRSAIASGDTAVLEIAKACLAAIGDAADRIGMVDWPDGVRRASAIVTQHEDVAAALKLLADFQAEAVDVPQSASVETETAAKDEFVDRSECGDRILEDMASSLLKLGAQLEELGRSEARIAVLSAADLVLRNDGMTRGDAGRDETMGTLRALVALSKLAIERSSYEDVAAIEGVLRETVDRLRSALFQDDGRRLENELGLPEEFLGALSQESTSAALRALDGDAVFVTVRASVEHDHELAGRFATWLTAGSGVEPITSVTVHHDTQAEFEFLIALASSNYPIEAALLELDPSGQWVRLTRRLERRSPPQTVRRTRYLAGGTGAYREVRQLAGEVTVSSSAMRLELARLMDRDLSGEIVKTLRKAAFIQTDIVDEVALTARGWQEELERLAEMELQIGSELRRLQDELSRLGSCPADTFVAGITSWASELGVTIYNACDGQSLEADHVAALDEFMRGLIGRHAESANRVGAPALEVSCAQTVDAVRLKVTAHAETTLPTALTSTEIGAIQGIGGRITADEREITIALPVGSTVVDGMVVRSGDLSYVVPIRAIERIIRMPRGNVFGATGGPCPLMLKLDDQQAVPIYHLGDGYGSTSLTEHGDAEDGLYVLAEAGEQRVAVAIDELHDQESVFVRPLEGYLGGIRHSAGCALLSSGDVGMIVDVHAMAKDTVASWL